MKLTSTLLFIFVFTSVAHANVICNRKAENGSMSIELVPTEVSGKYKIKTIRKQVTSTAILTRKNNQEEVSQPMDCAIQSNGTELIEATCKLSVLTVKFQKSVNQLFSITHEMVFPNRPDLKDPAAGSHGDDFGCQIRD